MKNHFQPLRDIPFFKSLSDEDIIKIQEVCQEENFDSGEVVFLEGTTGDRCFIILEGSVEIWKGYHTPDRDLLSIYQSGQLFGELALLDDSPRGATIVVKEPVNLLSIKRDDFNRILARSVTISVSIMKTITATIREQADHFLDNLRASKRSLEKAYARLREEIEERKKLETHLLQAQKMESIGTLAGGIAHDFKNILFIISGYTQLTLDNFPKDNKHRNKLIEVLIAVDRANDLIKQILTFSRQSTQDRRPVQIQIIAREVIKMLKSSLPASIQIRANIKKDCGAVMADPTHIHQVLMNICTNAYHAMQEKGGLLELSIDEIKVASGGQAVYPPKMPSGDYVMLSVSDSGCGMDKEVISRIFDPYFTTNKQGGTGLGLSIVHGIIKNHGGYISVLSEPGKGTTFQIYLPLLISRASLPQKVFSEPAPTGHERILIVDDEHKVAQMMQELLFSLGYQTEYRINSVEALRKFQDKPEIFDLVITDIDMPEMTGEDLARAMISVRPDIPIILCTGFSEIITEEKMADIGIRGLIMKPIIKNELAKIIRRILDVSQDGKCHS